MIKTHRSSMMFAVAAGMLLSATAAFASDTVPAQCAPNAGQYKTGYKLGMSMVTSAWNRQGHDCTKFDGLSTTVSGVYKKLLSDSKVIENGSPTYTPATVCRHLGMYVGVTDKLKTLGTECGRACGVDGQVAGELSAILYCELSIALGGLEVPEKLVGMLRPENETCRLSFERECNGQANSTAISYFIPATPLTPKLNCDTYMKRDPATGTKFNEIWDSTRQNMCIYELP